MLLVRDVQHASRDLFQHGSSAQSFGYTMNSSKLSSGSRMYMLVPIAAPPRRPPVRSTGPHSTGDPAPSKASRSSSTVPSHTKQKSPQPGDAVRPRSVDAGSCHRTGPWRLILFSPTCTDAKDVDVPGGRSCFVTANPKLL